MQSREIRSRPLSRLVEEREMILTRFLKTEGKAITRAAFDIARAFHRGGTLLPFGTALDAAHVADAFRRPEIGRDVLPAQAPNWQLTGSSRLSAFAHIDDIALGMTHATASPAVDAFLAAARHHGLLTLAFAGIRPVAAQTADHEFFVPSEDPLVVQEVHETTYRLLAELAHIFMEDPRRLDERCMRCGDRAFSALVLELSNGVATIERDGFIEEISVDLAEPDVAIGDVLLCHAGAALQRRWDQPTAGGALLGMRTELSSFLYSEVNDLDAGLAAACASTVSKRAEVASVVRTIDLTGIERCADAMRHRLERGGRLITLGDRHSSAGARDAAADFLARRWPAAAVVTHFPTVRSGGPNVVLVLDSFVDRLRPLARSDDVVLAIFTSGSASDLLAGLYEAHRRGALTCAITDESGGSGAALDWLDHRLLIPGESTAQVREAQTTICHLLLEMVGRP